jgi:hypothetical protein
LPPLDPGCINLTIDWNSHSPGGIYRSRVKQRSGTRDVEYEYLNMRGVYMTQQVEVEQHAKQLPKLLSHHPSSIPLHFIGALPKSALPSRRPTATSKSSQILPAINKS